MRPRPPDHSSRLAGGELAPERAERFASEHPEAYMRRRDFLARTAAVAGGAALAGALPAETLIAEAARSGLRPLPSPKNVPIDTFVILMMENRSFDHYFGWHPKADGRNEGLRFPDADGNKIPTYHLPPDYQGCGHPDPDHGWEGGRWQWHRGRCDRFVTGNKSGTGSDEFAIGYYLEDDLAFLPKVADEYTLYDRWFCSIMASTYPNRHYQWGAQSGGQKTNVIPSGTLGNQWETIFDRAEANGLTVGYYNSDLPVAALYGLRGIAWTKPIATFYAQAAAGTLPNICIVDPPFADGGGGQGCSADEHPHGDIRLGQAFMDDVTRAFVESPHYERGAMFIDYDEWGGFFDHVSPPFVPDDRRSRKLSEDFGFTGFRIPGVAISPFTRGGKVSHMPVTHESILKLISYRFKLGHLNKRHRYATNIGRTFDFGNPDPEPPDLPSPVAVCQSTCGAGATQSKDTAQRPKPHDMMLLETSGYLDRLGFDYKPPTYDAIFREPDSVRRAMEEGSRP